MLPDEMEGRPGDYTETADQKTSHDQATSTADSSDGGRERAPENCDQQQHSDAESGRAGGGEQEGWKDLPLDPEHVAMLVASGITSGQARLRGYETMSVLDRRRLRDEFLFSERAANRVPGLLIPRLNVDRQVWGYQFRPDCPFRPDNGGLAKYETRHRDPNALDIPPGVDADMLGAPGEPLWITEGVKKGDCGAVHGLCIVDVSGVWNWRGRNRMGGKVALPDWNEVALNGREVIICYDGDTQRKRQVRQAMGELAAFLTKKGAQVSCVWLPDTETKTGLDDYLHDHAVDELHQLIRPFDDKLDGDPGERRPSTATQLVAMARQEYRLGITDADEPFAHPKESHVAIMLRAGRTGLRTELARRYFAEHHTAAPQQALSDACATLEGFAAQTSPQRLHLRVAQAGDGIWIDMGDTANHVIHIYGGEWRVVRYAPVLFRRTKLTQAMPSPISGGELAALWRFAPVEEEDRPLVLACLVSALIQVDVAHPILALVAEQGSIKSTTTKHLVSLIDPTNPVMRKSPRNPEEWVTAANASWAVGLDNLSGMVPQWLSDCLCRASTGDGDVRRQLYTDGDVSVIAFRRVVVFNGIDVIVTQGDLADRLVRIKLPRVRAYLKDDVVARRWAEEHPNILGGLLDLAAQVHERLRTIEVKNPPRMADFAAVLACVDEKLGTRGLSRYREQARRIAADTLDHPFIAKLVEGNHAFDAQTSAEILATLTPDDKNWHPPRGWPASAQSVTGQLTRHAPALRAQGWEVSDDQGRNHLNVLRWTISPPEMARKKASPPSQPAQGDHEHKSEGMAEREGGREEGTRGTEERSRAYERKDHAARTQPSQLQGPSHTKTHSACEDEAASPARPKYGPSPVPNPRQCSSGQPPANELLDALLAEMKSNLLGGTNGESTANPNGGCKSRDPEWITGICDHCADRSGPPIVDRETGRCTKCWGRSPAGVGLTADDRQGVGDGQQ
jgi:hypothetical protein